MEFFNSSIQLAENLLESVDRRAAVKLQDEEDEDDGYTSRNDRKIKENEIKINNNEKDLKGQSDEDQSKESIDKSETKNNYDTTESLQKKIKKLNSELDYMDKQMAHSEKRIKKYEKEISDLEHEYSDRVGELQEELKELRFGKDKIINDLESTVADLQLSHNEFSSRIEMMNKQYEKKNAELKKVQGELKQHVENKEQMWIQAASGSNTKQTIEALELDLSESKAAHSALKLQHSEYQRLAQSRQIKLENTIRQLTKEVEETRNLKKIESQKEHADASSIDENSLEVEKLNATIKTMENTLKNEKNSRRTLERDNERLVMEISQLRTLIANQQSSKSKELVESQTEVDSLRKQLEELKKTKSESDDIQSIRQRLERMSDRLLQKQDIIDKANSRRAALENRLAISQKKCEQLEQERQRNIISDNHYGDLESPRVSRQSQRSTNRFSNISFIKKYPPIAEAADAIDRWVLLFGQTIRSNPIPRLIFVAYLILLHIWAFAVIGFHMNHLDEELAPDSKNLEDKIAIPGN